MTYFFSETEASFINDEQWRKLTPLLPRKIRGRPMIDMDSRRFFEAILWLIQSGLPWQSLPPKLGVADTVYTRFKRWTDAGRWHALLESVRGDVDLEILFGLIVARAEQQLIRARKRAAVDMQGLTATETLPNSMG